MPRALLLVLAIVALSLAAPSAASAQGGTFFECADFTPQSVLEACDRAVPIECRGPDAPSDFDQCLRDNGTTPEAVRAAIDSAMRAAGIPVGGVDTGLGGPARDGDADWTAWAPWGAAALLLVAAGLLARRRGAARR